MLENIIILYNNMFEFRINTKQSSMTFSGLKNSSKNFEPKSNSSKQTNYPIQFNNMFSNITNAKAGCRSCRGTF